MADDHAVREIVIDFSAGRWREAGAGWVKIAAQDDATITLIKRGGGILSDTSRLDQLDRSTLTLSTKLRVGFVDDVRVYRCKIVEPFNSRRQL